MKYIKKFEGNKIPLGSGKYELGDYVLIPDTKRNSYIKITEVRNSYWADYIITIYDIFTDNILEKIPVNEDEIIRKLTTDEINEIHIKKTAKKYNL